MREIKFRAWDNVKNQMYFVGEEEDVVFEIVGGKFVGYDAREELDAPCFKMEHLEVMQYTGLNDKNGVEVYEGDVVRDKEDQTYTVAYDDEYAAFILVWVSNDERFEAFEPMRELTVIGNIYEHPHLLEVSE